MKGALRIGRLSGIGVYIHWTFTFIMLYIAYQVLSDGGNFWEVLKGEVFLLLLFVCVVLHEMGHALAARKYGVNTLHIVLYPIGGVASLEKIPEDPFEEFIVAIAGPMVNVGILLGLGLYIYLFLDFPPFSKEEILAFVANLNVFDEFVVGLAFVNGMLIGFNLLPAFPMDGGRVLRSLLAMKLGRVKATKVASIVGQVFAILFVAGGFLSTPFQPFIVFIGVFVYFAAMSENRMVYTESTLSGFAVQDAMRTQFVTVGSNDPVSTAVKLLLASAEDDFIVVEENKPVGILFRKNLMDAIKAENAGSILDIAVRPIPLLSPSQDLQTALHLIQRKRLNMLPVVDESEQLIGVLDRRNISDFIAVQDVTKNR